MRDRSRRRTHRTPSQARWPTAAAVLLLLASAGGTTREFPRDAGTGKPDRPVIAQADQPAEKYRKTATGLTYAGQVRVEPLPGSGITPGFDSERIWSDQDDWEPALAADPNSGYVYQVTTRLSVRPTTVMFRRSSDNGATWGPDTEVLDDNEYQADPQIEVDQNGTVYVAFLDSNNTFLLRSFDHGTSWTAPVALPLPPPPYVDHELLAVSGDGQHVYLAFNANHSYVSASHDGGASFAAPVRTDSDNRQWFHTAYVVAPGGDVYFAVQDYSQSYLGATNVKIIKSTDRGHSWQTYLVDVSEQAPDCSWAAGCYTGFLGPTAGLGQDAGGVLAMVYNAGTKPGGNQRIWFRSSLDGIDWSERQAISPRSGEATHAFPLVVAGQAPGDFRVVWQGGEPNAWNTWYRRTTDGGAHWGPILRLSDRDGGAPYKTFRGYFFPYGDYFEIAVDGTGMNHLIWGEGKSYRGPGSSWYTRGQ